MVGNLVICARRQFSTHRNSTCKIFIDNVFGFELEGNLACARFVSECHVVVGNLVVCARRKYARFFDLAVVIGNMHVTMLEGNLAHVRFIFLQCCYWKYALACARSKFCMC